MLTRRRALKALLVAGTGAAMTGLYTWRVEPHWLEFTYPALPIANLPAGLEGKTLAQLTDLHVGPAVDDDYVIASLKRVQAMAPDFVVCTGDWITYRSPRQFHQLRRVLTSMPHGQLATVGILGNHDYGFGWGMVHVAEQVAEIAREAGVTMLSNQCLSVAGLQFVGIDDLWGPRFDPVAALASANEGAASIVLCHNPDAADFPVWKLYQGWILAGHTHGGQCKPPFLRPPELPVVNRRYTAGEFRLPGNRRMYISRGVGHLLRVRFNVRPEVPVFRLQRAEVPG
jgi:predicted MPP superfamily phosphohydrolase